MKEVLVLYYTQSGQLYDILQNIVGPIASDKVHITYQRIRPKAGYPFPWNQERFYDTFPENFLQIPEELEAPDEQTRSKKYDLIILGYQVWFLTPSRPITSFLKSAWAEQLMRDVPVVTVVACRNMWIQAQEKVKRLLHRVQARHVGHIALVDRNINHVSVITISHWMFSGKKDRYLGFFPKPGVSDKDIAEAERFGHPIREALGKDHYNGLQEQLLALGAVHINPYLVRTDERGNVVFSKWADLIIKKGGPGNPARLRWIRLFKYYLLFAIWVIAPIVFIVFLLTYLPMRKRRISERKYYSSVALKEN